MRRLFAIAGIALFLAPAMTCAQATDPYDRILSITRQDLLLDEDGKPAADPWILSFVAGTHPKEDVTTEDVTDALLGNTQALCPERQGRRGFDIGETCGNFRDALVQSTQRAAGFRALGRDLMITATSQESALDIAPGGTDDLLLQLQSINALWSVRSPSRTSAPPVNVVPVPPSDGLMAGIGILHGALLSTVGEAGGNTDTFTAAVWRYRRGMHAVQAETITPLTPEEVTAGGRRSFLLQRWNEGANDIEGPLAQILAQLPATPTLAPGEAVVFLFPPSVHDALSAGLPDGISVWAYRIRTADDIKEDIGFQWDLALTPVFPRLLTEDGKPALAGLYPPPPDDGVALCADPLQRLGYLCRFASNQDDCHTPPSDAETVTLTGCKSTEEELVTIAGPAVCPADAVANGPQCQVQVTCGPDCGGADAVVAPKTPDGIVQICVADNGALPGAYALLSAFTQARLSCGGAPGAAGDDCCTKTMEGNLVACTAMQQDGLFVEGNTPDGEPLTAKACAEAATLHSCGACPGLALDNGDAVLAAIALHAPATAAAIDAAGGNRIPWSCADGGASPRARAMLHDLQTPMPDVIRSCAPGSRSAFPNTIGNTLCFIGDCVRSILQQHTILPGRTALTASDTDSPWGSCRNPPTTAGDIAVVPPADSVVIPEYRPAALLREADRALCQTLGLPASSSVITCILRSPQALQFPGTSYADIALRLGQQDAQTFGMFNGQESLTDALGARIATTLSSSVIGDDTERFAALLRNAADAVALLRHLPPTPAICPRNAAGAQALCPVIP